MSSSNDENNNIVHQQEQQQQSQTTTAATNNPTTDTDAISSPASSYGSIPLHHRILHRQPPQPSPSSTTSSASSPDALHNNTSGLIRHTYRIVPARPHNRHGHHPTGGLLAIFQKADEQEDFDDDDDAFDDDDDDEEEEFLLHAKERLLQRADRFSLDYSVERGYRATNWRFWSIRRPHMRAMHASWICFFASYFVQFAFAPLLPQLQYSLSLSKVDIWMTNVWMMIGGIPMRFLLGPLCDTYGPRVVMVWMVTLCAIPCALGGLIVVNFATLLLVRFIMGAMDAFVPCQCWITSHFVREVAGTVMAIAGGLGASGSGVTQLVVGFLFYKVANSVDDDDLAWRLVLVVPAALALCVALWAYRCSDDCPLGNFVDVKKAGLMMERSAVDSFRSGAIKLNSWILFCQYAGSCGVDVTMCNGCALYFNQRFHQNIASAGAIAFLYGISAVYARGLGGYVSDRLYDRFSLQGRLWIQFACMLIQGGFNIWFARTATLGPSLIIMFVFSILVQVRICRSVCSHFVRHRIPHKFSFVFPIPHTHTHSHAHTHTQHNADVYGDLFWNCPLRR